jgi:hypothetical protein
LFPAPVEAGPIARNIKMKASSLLSIEFKRGIRQSRLPVIAADPNLRADFNQPVRDCVIQGPNKKYPAVTGAEFIKGSYYCDFGPIKESSFN